MSKPCTTIPKYEGALFVQYKGLILEKQDDLPNLSTFRNGYIDKVREEINEVFPEPRGGVSMADVEVFDPRLFKSTTRITLSAKFRRACKFFGINSINERFVSQNWFGNSIIIMNIAVLFRYVSEYADLVQKIKQDKTDLCSTDDSSPQLTWALLLEKHTVSNELRKIILRATSVPMGTASVERSFSTLNLIKDKRKVMLEKKSLEAQMRIR